MKVLFVTEDPSLEQLGILYLSSVLKKHGHSVRNAVLTSYQDLEREVEAYRPNILAYSVVSTAYKTYLNINIFLKSRFKDMKIFSIFGGPHPTYFPQMIECDGVDAICRGEGEYAFLELCDKMQKEEDIYNVKNLYFKKNGQIIKNDLRELIQDLDELPFPDRHLIDLKGAFYREVLTARGCPNNCTYCFNHAWRKLYNSKGKVIRKRSVDNVIGEIKQLKKEYPNLKSIFFQDDTFISSISHDLEWLLDFSYKYRNEILLPFYCQLSPNFVSEYIVRLLKEAGCIQIGTAIESGNDQLRQKVLRRYMSEGEIIKAAKIIKKHDIRLAIQNILLLPGETLDTAKETFELNIKCRADYSTASFFQPYPGIELTQYAIEKGFLDEAKWFDNFHDGSLLKFEDMRSKRQIENLHDLFIIGVKYPVLRSLIYVLINLPWKKIYWRVFEKSHYAYGNIEFFLYKIKAKRFYLPWLRFILLMLGIRELLMKILPDRVRQLLKRIF